MITIHRLLKYRKDELDYLIDLYINGRGWIVDYQKDCPPIELLPIPQSIFKSLCPKFISHTVDGNRNEIILTDENIRLLRSELGGNSKTEIYEIVSNEIIKFINRYETLKQTCHLAYQDDKA